MGPAGPGTMRLSLVAPAPKMALDALTKDEHVRLVMDAFIGVVSKPNSAQQTGECYGKGMVTIDWLSVRASASVSPPTCVCRARR